MAEQFKSRTNRLLDTLFLRLSLGLLLLLVFLTFVAVFLFNYFFKSASDRAEQVINWSVASNIARDIEREIASGKSYFSLQKLLDSYLLANPKLSIFILNSGGQILSSSSLQAKITRNVVPIDPIRRFLKAEANQAPIYNIDPTHYKDQAVFSAVNLALPDDEGFLYVVLSSKNHQRILTASQVRTAVFGGQYSIAIVAVAVAGVGLVLFYFLTRRLKLISTVLSEFRQGDFKNRIPVGKGSDEIALLASTVNTMADEIVSNIEALQKKDTLRRELIANVSHDLRAPASLIGGLTEVTLEEDKELSLITRRRCELVQEHCKSLTRMLMELFELAKLEAKEIQPKFELFSVTELVEEITDAYAMKGKKQDVRVYHEVVGNPPMALGDTVMIARVLNNLIDNALRYTPAGGAVIVRVGYGTKVKLEVCDTGAGIPAADLPHIFERLYQVKQTNNLQNGLSGLGLAIVRKIVEAHGSEIRVASEVNIGTVFSFELSTS